jgi:hypothetical protein
MVNGIFLGGFQEGQSERREFEQKKRIQDKADKRADEELDLNKKRYGLAAAEQALSERRFWFEQEKEKTDTRLRERGLSAQERAVAISERDQQFKERQEIAKRADEAINGLMLSIKETAGVLKETGASSEKIADVVKPFADKILSLSEKTGLQSDHYLNQIQAILAQPTAAELEAAKGVATAKGQVAHAAALESAGINTQSAQETAGIKGPPKSIDLRTFTFPDGTRKSVRADDAAGINAALDAGGVSTPLSVQASNVGDIASVSAPDKKAIAEASSAVRDIQKNIEELDRTAQAFKKNPEAAGIQGAIIETGLGLVAQLPVIGKQIASKAEGIAGIDRKEITKTRTAARTAIANMISLVSGDTSRFSDQDRKLAESTGRTLTADSDDETVIAALNTVIEIMERSQLFEIDELRAAAKISLRDLATDEGVEKLGELLTNKGMTEDQAINAIIRLKQRNRLR